MLVRGEKKLFRKYFRRTWYIKVGMPFCRLFKSRTTEVHGRFVDFLSLHRNPHYKPGVRNIFNSIMKRRYFGEMTSENVSPNIVYVIIFWQLFNKKPDNRVVNLSTKMQLKFSSKNMISLRWYWNLILIRFIFYEYYLHNYAELNMDSLSLSAKGI